MRRFNLFALAVMVFGAAGFSRPSFAQTPQTPQSPPTTQPAVPAPTPTPELKSDKKIQPITGKDAKTPTGEQL
ncbi:MAG TPA: hypothetical protein VGB05_10910, partial [Pyrinomonadaceae bacterium]